MNAATIPNNDIDKISGCIYQAIGKPFLDSTYTVEATVLRHLSGPKIRVYKMRPKKKTRKTFGSRRKLTRVLINSISKK